MFYFYLYGTLFGIITHLHSILKAEVNQLNEYLNNSESEQYITIDSLELFYLPVST